MLSVITLFTFPFFLFFTLDSAFGIQLGSLAGISAHCWGLFNQWGMYKEGHESSQERDTRECVESELEAGGYIDLAPHQAAAAAAATTARTVKIQRYVAKEFNDPSILGHCVDYVKQLSAPIWAGKCALALRRRRRQSQSHCPFRWLPAQACKCLFLILCRSLAPSLCLSHSLAELTSRPKATRPCPRPCNLVKGPNGI